MIQLIKGKHIGRLFWAWGWARARFGEGLERKRDEMKALKRDQFETLPRPIEHAGNLSSVLFWHAVEESEVRSRGWSPVPKLKDKPAS